FHSLGLEELKRIVEIQAERLRRMLAERNMRLELTEEAKELLAERGFDPAYGARPIKRTLQRLVADPLALAILEGRFRDGDTVRVAANGNGIHFERAETALEGEVVE
ncbi:MAG: type VI secretion system ATPase TssH, partial [Chloroflexi bacterium]|nr:type VI secretion system ATPase TssH [Chloroflexota bacterium]